MCSQKLDNKMLYATSESLCFGITSEGSAEVSALECHQEKDDGRLLLHAAHAGQDGYSSVMICSEDTNVFVICSWRLLTGSQYPCSPSRSRARLININHAAHCFGQVVCKAVYGMHAYTACD